MAMPKKQGLSFRLKTAVKAAKTSKSGVTLTVEPAGGGDAETIKADIALVAVGRHPATESLGLDDVGVALSDRGRIRVDSRFETSVEDIYAIGDVIDGPMLAHKAEEDGVAAVEMMAGQAGHVDYDLVPGIVYTAPEVATLGKSEDLLKADGTAYKKGSFSFSANSRARASGHPEGFVKILACAETDRVLGVHIIGHEAGTIIHECATAMVFGASSEDIARTCHGHPTLNEAVKEAALAVDGRAIHMSRAPAGIRPSAWTPRPLTRPRMRFPMQVYKMRLVDAGIALCGGQAGMAEQFLDCAQVCTIPEKMCGKGMAQRMRRHMRRQVEFTTQSFDQPLCGARPHRFAARADKQRAGGSVIKRAGGVIICHSFCHRAQHRDLANLASLAGNAHPAVKRHSCTGHRQRFGNTQPAAI